jgi:hypothetical protein
MTLGELKAQFKGLLNNNVVNKNDALITTFINQSIMRIQRELRVPFMEKQILFTIPESYTKLAIPADLLELIAIMVDTDNDGILEYELTRTDLTRVMRETQVPGMSPRVFTRQGGSWILGPKPGAGSQVLIHYYAEFAAVSADTDTNTCLKVAWDAVLYGALSAASDYLQDDERGPKFEGRYGQITKQLQDQADSDELTADAVMAPALPIGSDDGYDW